jgi:uncharacterized delta-60 repeat protein
MRLDLQIGAAWAVAADGRPANATTTSVALHATGVAVARYNSDGSLDTTFNATGVLAPQAQDQSFANALVIQPDGRIVIAGALSNVASGGVQFYVERINPDGSPDTSFGSGGAVSIRPGRVDGEAHAVALQPDGKLVVAGTAFGSGNLRDQFGLARYNPDGSLDASFGTAGSLTTSVGPGGSEARGVALQPDGKIVAAGTAFANGLTDDDFALVRYNVDGSLDSSFGVGGVTTTDFGSLEPGQLAPFDHANAIAVQPDGRIVVVGTTGGLATDFAIARYNPDGTLDVTFGLGGLATSRVAGGAQAFAVGIQPDSRILLAGNGGATTAGEPFVLARHNLDGSVDVGFGSGGQVRAGFEGGASGARAVAIQADGAIVVGGSGYGPMPAASDVPNGGFAVQRWRMDGSPDTSFGSGGVVLTTVGDAGSIINALALQPDGRIVVAGLANYRVVTAAGPLLLRQAQDKTIRLER